MINANLQNVNYLFMQNQSVVDAACNKLIVDMSFGDWLRKKIKASGLSNAEVARRADVSSTYIGNLIRDFSPNTKSGKGRPSEEVVAAIAKAVGVDVDEARLAAGYLPINDIPALFYNGDKLVDEERVLVQDLINKLAAKTPRRR